VHEGPTGVDVQVYPEGHGVCASQCPGATQVVDAGSAHTQSALTGTKAQRSPVGHVPLHEPPTLHDSNVVVVVLSVVVVVVLIVVAPAFVQTSQ